MKNYAKEHGYTELDFIIEEQRTRVHETAKQLCPSHCYECNELFGNVDVDIIEPFCDILYDKCPDDFHECPIFKEKIKNMNIPNECKKCDLIILDIYKSKSSIYCDTTLCKHYENTSKWDNPKGVK